MKYIVLPMQPTPNGRMHIGHGGGTYLRADIVARSLRSQGHEVEVICGSDAYENWILAASQIDGTTPEETCARNHAGIQEDLSALDVTFDWWIDPLADAHRAAYAEVHEHAFGDLRNLPGAAERPERIPVDGAGAPLMGTFIAGNCPHCGESAGGSSCTACSQHFQPDEILEPRARLTGGPVSWREEETWFLTPPRPLEIVDELARRGVEERHLDVVRGYMHSTGGRVRLSGPGSWGVPGRELPAGHVLSNSYYLYCVYAASLSTLGSGAGAFTPDAEVETIGIFGSDNTMPGLVVPHVYEQITDGRRRAFDHVLINGMLDLDGRKCSTSKRYGIWLKDILGKKLVTSDELRFALAGADLDSGRANLDLERLVADVNEFRRLVHTRVLPAVSSDRTTDDIPDFSTVEKFHELLSPGAFNLSRAREVLVEVLQSDSMSWLATLTSIAGPITPRLAAFLSNDLSTFPTTIEHVSLHGSLAAEDLEPVVCRGIEDTPSSPSELGSEEEADR